MAASSTMAFRDQVVSAASPVPRYRRSTLTKAPRKRSFIANMLKYSANGMPTSGSASAGVSTKVGAFYAPLCLLDGGNDNNGAGRFGGNGRSGGGEGNGEEFSGMDTPASSPLPGLAVLILAITAMTVLSPAAHSIAQEVYAADPDMEARVTAPRSISAIKGELPFAKQAASFPPAATLSWSSATAPVLGPGFGGQIVYGRIHLSADERLMLSSSVRMVCM